MKKLRKLKYNLIALKYLVTEEVKNKTKGHFLRKIKLLTNGFTSEKYDLYDFKNKDMNKYLSDFQRMNTVKINRPYSILLNDKQLFEQLFESEKIVPKVYGEINSDNYYLNDKKVSIEEVINLMKKKREVIVKKVSGGGGKGIYRVSYSANVFFIDNKKMTKTKLIEFLEKIKNSLITEHLKQADYANKIFPGTINTIRVLVMRDPSTKEPFIATAVHKFGSKKTEPVDNVSNGGITALVNLETGVLEKSALHSQNNKKIKWKKLHPDTNEMIEGSQISHWNEIKKEVLLITNKFKQIQYVGWDVVVTKEGFKIIEGNNYSDVNILQIHQPLLENEKVKAFYEYHEII